MGAELLVDQLSFNLGTIKINTKGLTHEESLVAPPGGGNCLNWIVGHLVSSRNGLLKLLGCEGVWDKERAELYKRGSDPISAGDAVAFEEILADFAAAQEPIVAALRALSDEELAAPTTARYLKGDDETLGSALATFVFHEAYHAGQTGLLRRILGKDGAIK